MGKNSKGIIITYVLVFGAIFLILLGGLLGFILLQLRQSVQKVAWSESLYIAEAGIKYYQWCLNNDVESQCQNEKDYFDSNGVVAGKFSIETTSTTSCGQTIRKQIVSTGWTNDFPNIKRKVSVLYARESVAKYSYLLNNNVWVWSDAEIKGPYHSNGGIRMDGENQSLVTSAVDKWICTPGTFCLGSCPTADGCWLEGTDCYCPGVFTTANGDPNLFSFPAPYFNFAGITADLSQLKTLAQGGQGKYFGPSGKEGYYIIFKDNRSIDVWTVDSVTTIDNVCTIVGFKLICDDDPCDTELCSECQSGKCVIHDPGFNPAPPPTGNPRTFLGNYSIPEGCGLVFFEDNLWVGNASEESKIKGKITIVSANFETGAKTDVWLQGDINYTTSDGTDGLAIIAQHNNLIGLYSPDQMELKGIFIAQSGYFGRNGYFPCPGLSHCLRSKLEITGSVVSDGRVGSKWYGGQSGYLERESYFDSNLIYNPPPFVPYAESDFKIMNWEEIE